MYSPMVIGVNGPPRSGKGWLIQRLAEMIPDCAVLQVQDSILACMQRDGLAPPGLTYAQYKRSEHFFRAKFIGYAQSQRAIDVDVFSRMTTEDPKYREHRVIIFDNIGFQDEVNWFEHHCNILMVLRLDVPYDVSDEVDFFSTLRRDSTRRIGETWRGDSRGPVTFPFMLTAYDSLQMWHLLQWLNGRLTREEAGPYYECKSIWDKFFRFRGDAVADLFGVRRDAGELGRLDSAAGRLAGDRDFGNGISSGGRPRKSSSD